MYLGCLYFMPEGYNLGEGWQGTTFHMVFDVKHNLRSKYELVAGGNLIYMMNISI